MSAARPLADIMPDLLANAERLASFQAVLNGMGTPAEQKAAIIGAHCHGLLTHDDTALLIQVYALEEA